MRENRDRAMLYDFLYELSVVGSEGNLSAAAKKLGLSRPSLGRHMASLEAMLGVCLMERSPEGVTLTGEGREALRVADAVASLGEGVKRHYASETLIVNERNLVLGGLTDCGTALWVLSEGVDRMNASGANVGLRQKEPQSVQAALSALLDGELDIVLGWKADVAQALERPVLGLSCVKLCTVPAAVALDGSNRIASRQSVGIQELAECDFVRAFSARFAAGDAWNEFQRACRGVGFAPRSREALYNSRYGIDIWGPEEAVVCATEGFLADRMRGMGRTVVPVKGLSYEVDAIVRSDDFLVAKLLSYLGSNMGEIAASHQSIYGSVPRSDVRVENLSLEERGRLLERVLDESRVPTDLILPDGTVVDKAYVALRNRLNRIGDGVSGNPVETSFEAVMNLWSVEEARAMLELPMFGWFTAYDWAAESGRDVGECDLMLERLSSRNLIYRVRRAGTCYYSLLSWAYGIWEFKLRSYDDTDFLQWGMYGRDVGTGSQYPIMHTCPVGSEAVRGGKIVPYRSWEDYVRRQPLICVAPCQCHRSKKVLEPETYSSNGHPDEVCFTFGEMAEYWLENGLGHRVNVEECVSAANTAIHVHGLVPQFYYDKNPEVLCFCHPDSCLVLSAIKSTGGMASSMPNVSAYQVVYDEGWCDRCGVCVERCPMDAITLDDDGKMGLNKTCVACGQCVIACHNGARILDVKPSDQIGPLPDDMVDGFKWRSVDRMAKGYISDFTGRHLHG